jgi:hypothetical protein
MITLMIQMTPPAMPIRPAVRARDDVCIQISLLKKWITWQQYGARRGGRKGADAQEQREEVLGSLSSFSLRSHHAGTELLTESQPR